MERKTKHRLLGIMVVIGLVIILLPLFQDTKEIPPTTTLATAPPFPDQSEQVTAMGETNAAPEKPTEPVSDLALNTENKEATVVNDEPDDTIAANESSPKPIIEVAQTTVVPPLSPVAQENVVSSTTDATPKVVSETTASSPLAPEEKTLTAKETLKENSEVVSKDLITASTDSKASAESAKKYHYRILEDKKVVQKEDINALMKPHAISASLHVDENGLSNLKQSGWVIQIGSFKKKENALRVVDQLKNNGYHAFIQQTKTALGNQTRVFVGPENKFNLAQALVSKIQQEMHMEAIVVKYQPISA